MIFLSACKLCQLSAQGSRFCLFLLCCEDIHNNNNSFIDLVACFLGSIICVRYTLFLCYIQLPLCMAVLSSTTQWQKTRKFVLLVFGLWLFSFWVMFYWIDGLFCGTLKANWRISLKFQADKTPCENIHNPGNMSLIVLFLMTYRKVANSRWLPDNYQMATWWLSDDCLKTEDSRA